MSESPNELQAPWGSNTEDLPERERMGRTMPFIGKNIQHFWSFWWQCRGVVKSKDSGPRHSFFILTWPWESSYSLCAFFFLIWKMETTEPLLGGYELIFIKPLKQFRPCVKFYMSIWNENKRLELQAVACFGEISSSTTALHSNEL